MGKVNWEAQIMNHESRITKRITNHETNHESRITKRSRITNHETNHESRGWRTTSGSPLIYIYIYLSHTALFLRSFKGAPSLIFRDRLSGRSQDWKWRQRPTDLNNTTSNKQCNRPMLNVAAMLNNQCFVATPRNQCSMYKGKLLAPTFIPISNSCIAY